MIVSRIINIKETGAGEIADESAFLQRKNDADSYITAKQIETYIDAPKRAEFNAEVAARKEADTTLQANIDAEESARKEAVTAEETARKEADTTLQTNIDSEASARETAVSAEAAARESSDTALQTQITANKTAIDTLNGTGEGSVTKTVTDKIAEVVADAPSDFDTLKEISDWISGHEEDAAAMNSAIKANSDAIGTKLDKTTDTANAGKAVVVDDEGKLGFGTAGIDTDAVKSLIKSNAADADYDEDTTIRAKLDQIGSKVVKLTKAEYDALEEKDSDTLYVVTDDDEATDNLNERVIDDSAPSASTTYSSEKIDEIIGSDSFMDYYNEIPITPVTIAANSSGTLVTGLESTSDNNLALAPVYLRYAGGAVYLNAVVRDGVLTFDVWNPNSTSLTVKKVWFGVIKQSRTKLHQQTLD